MDSPQSRRALRGWQASLLLRWALGIGCVLILCAAIATAQSASNAPSPSAGASTYVGSDTCKTCHAEVYEKHFANTPHAVLLKDDKHGCEECHGPGSEHAKSGDPTKIIRFSTLTPAEASRRCMKCHQSNQENSAFAESVHLSQGVGCLSCHSPHHSTAPQALLVKQQTLLCYGCHAQQRAEFARPYRHRVDVGLIQCSDCHNPHGSFHQNQLRTADGGMEVCNKCHSEKMGPFAFEHMPVKQEGCTGCHTPHGSTNPRQLRVSQVNVLCLQCHSPIANRDTPEAPSFHNQSTKYQACTLCHTQIHGSNFDEFFFR